MTIEQSTAMKHKLREMRAQDIRDVDPERVSDFGDIDVDPSLPVADRVKSLLAQTDNPYCFKYNGMIVKMSFAGKMTIEECLTSCFFSD